MHVGPWQEFRLHRLLHQQREMLAALLRQHPEIDMKVLADQQQQQQSQRAPAALPSVVGGGQSYADSVYAASEAGSTHSSAASSVYSHASDPGLRYGLRYQEPADNSHNNRFGLGRRHLQRKKKRRKLKLEQALEKGKDYTRNKANKTSMPDVIVPGKRFQLPSSSSSSSSSAAAAVKASVNGRRSNLSNAHNGESKTFVKAIVKLPPWMSKFSGRSHLPTTTTTNSPSSSSSQISTHRSTSSSASASSSFNNNRIDYSYRSFLNNNNTNNNNNTKPRKKKKKPIIDTRPNHEKVTRPAYVYPSNQQHSSSSSAAAAAINYDINTHTKALFDGIQAPQALPPGSGNPHYNHHSYNVHHHLTHKVQELKMPRAITPQLENNWEDDADKLIEWTSTLKDGMLDSLSDG